MADVLVRPEDRERRVFKAGGKEEHQAAHVLLSHRSIALRATPNECVRGYTNALLGRCCFDTEDS